MMIFRILGRSRFVSFFVFFMMYLSVSGQNSLFFANTENHLQEITDIVADTQGKYIVTSSKDNTLRVYNYSDGKYLKTIFLPFENYLQKNEFKTLITDVEFFPDGKKIACAGNLGNLAQKQYSIYVFDIETGQIEYSIDQSEDAFYKIAISANNNHLACALSNGKILVYNGNKLIFSDHSNKIACKPIFDQSGNLYTLSIFKKLKIFAAHDYKLLTDYTVDSDENMLYFSVTPNGQDMAYGYIGENINPKSLTYKSKIKASEQFKAQFNDSYLILNIAYSKDGNYLYGSSSVFDHLGIMRGTGTPYILKWDIKKPLNPGSFSLPVNIIPYGLVTLVNGDIAFWNERNAWGVMDSNGKIKYQKNSDLINFSGQKDMLTVSFDGSVVGFAMDGKGNNPLAFSAKAGLMEEASFLKPPKKSPVNIERLQKSQETAQIIPGEKVISFSISWDNKYMILATSFRLICIDMDGNVAWITYTNSEVHAVNISGNGLFTISALEDGTIRWYNTSNGKEVLALYMSATDHEKWILWTPDGNYKASASGGSLPAWIKSINESATMLTKNVDIQNNINKINQLFK